MNYFSTRNNKDSYTFLQVALKGLASDGGLYIPVAFPQIYNQCNRNEDSTYHDFVYDILKVYIDKEIESDDLKELIQTSYLNFNEEIIGIKQFEENYLAELFHGPTYSFKDYALQFLGNLFEYILKQQKKELIIIGATSGDTGSAAIHALKGKKNIKIFMLYPNQKVSEFQEKQMTCIAEENVYPIAVEGNFDDCQNNVKLLLNDDQLNQKYNLSAVNSMNWVRVLLQIVYYFFIYSRVARKNQKISFSVPSGNFGNMYAGFIAKQMGLPIDKLIIATNENNILTRVLNTGEYKMGKVYKTITPSMDIQKASNFERFLFFLFQHDAQKINQTFLQLSEKNYFQLNTQELKQFQNYFSSYSINQQETAKIMKEFYQKYNYILDPHSAVGYAATVKEKMMNEKAKIVTLCTAHPIKFTQTIQETLGIALQEDQFEIPSKKVNTSAHVDDIKKYILKNI